MRGVGGRKALVVYSDGIGEGEDFPFSASLKAARESGIPVYLIVTHTEAARTDGQGPRIRSYAERLRKLSEVSGGRTYFVDHDQDLRALYREVLSELRSQYVLSYYPPETSDGEPWREVGVEMTKKGLRARTISGYYGEK
jgi:VWFA-related protein